MASYRSAHKLYQLLLEPVEQLTFKPNTIYLIPHHVTNYLPFSALVKKLNTENLLSSEFYAEIAPPLSYVPSLSLLEKKTEVRYDAPSKIFYRSDFSNTPLFYDLPNAYNEANRMATILKAPVMSKEEFSLDALKKTSSLNVLYIASHIKTGVKTAETGLVLGTNSDLLTVKKIIDQLANKLKTNLTVLSLCQTNLGEEKPLPGDDLANLSRSFLMAGSRAVVTSQWNISDEYTPKILQELITNYRSGKTAPKSLDIATKNYLSKVKSQFYRHPFYWANLLILEK